MNPILSSEVRKCPLCNPIIRISKLSRILEGVAQEIAVQAIAPERHVDSGASVDAVLVFDLGIVRENFRDVAAKDFSNVGEV